MVCFSFISNVSLSSIVFRGRYTYFVGVIDRPNFHRLFSFIVYVMDL
jgi:hypothetical protein